MTGGAPIDLFADLTTLEEVADHVRDAYCAPHRRQGPWPPAAAGAPRLPLSVAEPGPLMAHAVRLAGDQGLTRQQLRGIFAPLGKERFDRGLRQLRSMDACRETQEGRPNKAGRTQRQVVFYGSGSRQ